MSNRMGKLQIIIAVMCAAIIDLFALSNPAVAQGRRQPPRRGDNRPIPGIMLGDNVPDDAWAALRWQFQGQLDQRDEQRAEFRREARQLRRAYDDAPESPDAPRMLFQAGYRFLQAEDWEAAEESLRILVADHSDSNWSREARLCLFEFVIEVNLDVEEAAALLAVEPTPASDEPVDVESDPPASESPAEPPTQEPKMRREGWPSEEEEIDFGPPLPIEVLGPVMTVDANGNITARPARQLQGEFELRHGLLAYMQGETSSARRFFSDAKELLPSIQGPIWGLASAMTVDFGPAYAYPPEAALGEQPAAALICYVDLLFEGQQSHRAFAMADRLLKRRSLELTPEQRSYLLFRRGFARYRFINPLERDPELVLEDYADSVRIAEDSPWADLVLFMAGNVAWNLFNDADRASELWQRVMDDYPSSPHATEAGFNIGMGYQNVENWEAAYLAFHAVLDRYPDTRMRENIEERLEDIERHIPEELIREPADPTPAVVEEQR
jgi:tetratricopeptide (TPR) repeat protein